MERQVSISPILENRYNLASDRQTVRLRVTYNRKSQYISLKLYLTPEEFEKAMSQKPGKNLLKVRKTIDEERTKAINIISEMPKFTFDEFKRRFGSATGKIDFFERMRIEAENLRKEGREKYAIGFETSLNSLIKYSGKEVLMAENINADFLNKYEQWMLQQGRSKTTIGIYLRNVRTVFNQEIEAKNISSDLYPFGKSKAKFKIPAGTGTKKFLEKDELKKLYQHKVIPGSPAHRFRDYWFFIYLCNGLNVKDMGMLRYKNVIDEKILFVREKTKNTTKGNEIKIEVPLLPEAKEIINKWGNNCIDSNTFIFPILKEALTPRQVVRRIEDTVSDINTTMQKIAKEAGVNKNVTTYVARHTFATMLKREGFSTEFIQEALGHTDVRTTRSYLGSFDSGTKQKAAKSLLAFD